MSLALDDLLDTNDRARFEQSLAAYPVLADTWRAWQQMDNQLADLEHVEPAPGFVNRFEARLLAQEQQQQRWLVSFAAVIAVVAGTLMAAATLGLGVYVFGVQGAWLGAQLHNFIFAVTALSTWVNALVGTLASLSSTPQAQMLGTGYLVVVCAMLAAWIQLLRRSGQLASALPTIGLE